MRAIAAIATLLVVPIHLGAKGETVRIVIRGGGLTSPIELKEEAITARFRVGTGPGTSRGSFDTRRVEEHEPGLIVDWRRGVATPPKEFHAYEVSFVTTRTDPSTYVVLYAVDPATNRGYVYIPGELDAPYRDNTHLIYRGVEGKWFHAWEAWEAIANPLIAKAQKGR
jgi:hypothetical protein